MGRSGRGLSGVDWVKLSGVSGKVDCSWMWNVLSGFLVEWEK